MSEAAVGSRRIRHLLYQETRHMSPRGHALQSYKARNALIALADFRNWPNANSPRWVGSRWRILPAEDQLLPIWEGS